MKAWWASALVMILAACGIVWLMRPAAPPAMEPSPGLSPASQTRSEETRRKLQEIAPHVRFDGVPLDQVIEQIHVASGVNIFVDWASLELAGIERKPPIGLDLRDATWAQILSRVLQIPRTSTSFVAYTVSDGIVIVGDRDVILREATVTRTYDIRDLIESDIAWRRRLMGPITARAASDAFNAAVYDESIDTIAKIITEVVSIESWKENGGMIGAFKELNGRLIITQSTEAHEAIEQLLAEMRQPNSVLRLRPRTQPTKSLDDPIPPPGVPACPP